MGIFLPRIRYGPINSQGGSLFAEQVIFCKSELKQLFFYKSEKCE